MSISYWSVAAAVTPPTVATEAWAWLYVCCALAMPLTARITVGRQPRFWLLVAGYAVIFAAGFYGANQGLDALHGAHRNKADVAAALGGIELWFVLVPGVASIAIGGLTRAFLNRQRDRAAPH